MRISDWSSDVCSSDLPDVIEVLLNPDGTLWTDRLSNGRAPTGISLSAADAERIIKVVAHHVGVEVDRRTPLLSAELPETGERFEGLLPPVVAAPSFAIRKRASLVFTLDRYVERSEEHTSELQSLMRISYAVFCLKKKKAPNTIT